MRDPKLNLLEISSTGQSADFLIATCSKQNQKSIWRLYHQLPSNPRKNKIKKTWMTGPLVTETILQLGAIKIRNMFRQNQQLKIKYNQQHKPILNLQLQLNLKKNKTRKIWMTGPQVTEITPPHGAIRIRSMYKLLQKQTLNKKVRLQHKQKLKLNPQLQLNLKKNKTKKTWKTGHQDTETILQPSTKMTNSWFKQNQK